MGRRLRYIPPGGCVVEVTNRTLQGRYLLRPSRQLNKLLLGILGRAQRLYEVKLHAFVVLSNHYHLLLTVDSAQQMAQFMAYFQGNLAKEAGRLHGWRGPFWHRRYQHIPVSDEDAAQIDRLHYILVNGCKENLVSSPLDWPGVSSTRALVAGEQLQGVWINRTQERFVTPRVKKNSSLFCEPERVILSPLPCWKHLHLGDQRQRVREMVSLIEAETAHRHRAEGSRPLGAREVLLQDPHDKPLHPKWSPAPLIHCVSKQIRDRLREAYGCFYSAYRQAADRLQGGDLLAVFPEGAFPPPRPFQEPIRAPG